MKFDLVIAGVGGQGNILASQAVARSAMDAGYNVVNTETKGAAQRGGSVLSHVRIADGEIFSPLVPQEQAEVLLGFEPLEAMRYINMLGKHGKFIINTAPVPTILSNLKVDEYPSRDQMISAITNELGFSKEEIAETVMWYPPEVEQLFSLSCQTQTRPNLRVVK